MERYSGPLIVIAFGLGFLLLVVVNFGPLAKEPGRPTELQPAPPVVCPTCPAGQAAASASQPDTGSPAPAPEVVEIHDLARLTPTDAARLDGKRALYRVVIDGPRDRQGGRDVYEVLPRDDPQGILLLHYGPTDRDAEGELVVEAQLAVVRLPVHVVGATATPAFTEYRLVDAVRVGP